METLKTNLIIILVVPIVLVFVIWAVCSIVSACRPKIYNISNELSRIQGMSGISFENWCAELLRRNGYTNIRTTSTTGDYGADIICYKANSKYVVQCKRYAKTVGIKPVQEIIAARIHYSATVMMVMTNNRYSESAIRLAKESNVHLYDYYDLRILMQTANNRYSKQFKQQKSSEQEHSTQFINSTGNAQQTRNNFVDGRIMSSSFEVSEQYRQAMSRYREIEAQNARQLQESYEREMNTVKAGNTFIDGRIMSTSFEASEEYRQAMSRCREFEAQSARQLQGTYECEMSTVKNS